MVRITDHQAQHLQAMNLGRPPTEAEVEALPDVSPHVIRREPILSQEPLSTFGLRGGVVLSV